MATRYCQQCDYSWDSRIDNPKECPRCKSRNWYLASKVQRQVVQKVRTAVKYGKLEKQPCEVCGTTKNVDAHHDDYEKPLEVRWLCKSHHKLHHLKNGPAKNSAPKPETKIDDSPEYQQ